MRRSGCAVKMISRVSCVAGADYVPTPRDGGCPPPERPLHTHRDTFEGGPNVQTDVATLALEPRARERRSCAGRVIDCRAPCDEGLRRRRRASASATREEGERVETRMATFLADEAENDARGRVRRRDDARGRGARGVEFGERVRVAVHDVLVADVRDRRR